MAVGVLVEPGGGVGVKVAVGVLVEPGGGEEVLVGVAVEVGVELGTVQTQSES